MVGQALDVYANFRLMQELIHCNCAGSPFYLE